MKQFNALMRKEWQTHWTTLLIPTWFTVGAVIITLIGMIYNLIQGNPMLISADFPVFTEVQRSLILWGANRAGISMLGFIGIITGVILADAMLNGAYKRRCEIFHLSQPVSYTTIVTAKLALMALVVIAQVVLIGILGSLVSTAYVANFIHGSLVQGMIGLWQGLIDFVFAFLFVSSIAWFFAGVFKRKSFFLAVLILVGIHLATMLLNKITGLGIPSLTGYILHLASLSVNIGPSEMSMKLMDFRQFISVQWEALFSLEMLLRAFYSAVLFVLSYVFYRRREIA